MQSYVEFPALGWHIPLNDTLAQFTLFGAEFTIKWYGIIIALGFMLAVIFGLRQARRFGIDPDRMIDVVLVCTVLGFVGARLYYVLFSSERAEFFADPVSILYIWKGGIGIYGGIIAAFLSGILMCRLRKINTLAMFDLTALGFLIGQGIGRWGNFFNQEAFGGNTTLPWGMTGDIIQSGVNGDGYDPALPVHPTFFYESLWCLIGFALLFMLFKKAYKFKGQIFSLYVIWYGTARFFIELLRTDSLMMGNMKISCFVAVLAVLGGLMLYVIFKNRANASPKALAVDGPTITLEREDEEEPVAELIGEDVVDEDSVAELAVLDGAEAEDEHGDDY